MTDIKIPRCAPGLAPGTTCFNTRCGLHQMDKHGQKSYLIAKSRFRDDAQQIIIDQKQQCLDDGMDTEHDISPFAVKQEFQAEVEPQEPNQMLMQVAERLGGLLDNSMCSGANPAICDELRRLRQDVLEYLH